MPRFIFKFFLTVSVSAIFFSCFSQSPKNRVLSIPVIRNTISLKEPWTGGLNSPQFSAINLNDDNLDDLFVFDRAGDKVLTYINTGTSGDTAYVYAPKYEELFPADLNSWTLIRDYNNDGIPDIFTHASLGIRVYKGSMQNCALHFELVAPTLFYFDGINHVNIFTNVDDMPVFADVNYDGDIDVLTYGIFGATVQYFENQTMEHPGDIHYAADSLKYIDATLCWGNFSGNALNNSISLNVPCPHKTELEIPLEGSRDSGNTIFDFDFDNDHDVDLLNGSIGYNTLALLQNCGDSSYANVCFKDSAFPTCNLIVDLPTFPAAYGVDVNNDGLKDLLISPNARSGARDIKNVMFYRNTNNPACQFVFETDTFLEEKQIDVGTESKPVLFDFNGDGLNDLVIGNYGYFRPFQTYKSTLAIYYNTGTASQPQFTEIASDYKDFSNNLFVNAAPAFGDLDGDAQADMLVGDINGYLHYFKNTGGTVASFVSVTTPQYFGIDVGQNAAPFIYDLNGDSLNDLVVGKKDGKISYFWNFGTRTNPMFHKDSVNTYFGQVNVTQLGYSDGSSQPVVLKEANGNLKLFVGSTRGTVQEYDLDVAKLRSGAFFKIDSNFIKHDVGSKAFITIGDLNNDGLLEYVIGNSRGGLMIYSDSIWDAETVCTVSNLPSNKADYYGIKIYPNPSRNYFVCEMLNQNFIHPKTEVFNILGEKINVENTFSGKRLTINTSLISSGFYVVRITDEGKTFTGKILLEQ